MLLLGWSILVEREEKHVELVGVLHFEILCESLSLLDLVTLVVHRPFEHVNGLRQQRDIKPII